MSKYCIIGRHGFLGGALAARLGSEVGHLTKDIKVLFHFGSHVHPVFELNSEWEMKRVLDEYTYLLPFCSENGILFVHPSSALVYERDTTFSKFKKVLEQLVSCYKARSIGLRLFPVYGLGEQRTVISSWVRQMVQGRSPLVYGDGTQSRDFIYIDDVVDQILSVVELNAFKSATIANIGTGELTSFNDIIEMINVALNQKIIPQYTSKPVHYPEGIACPNPMPFKTTVEFGIRKIVKGVVNG